MLNIQYIPHKNCTLLNSQIFFMFLELPSLQVIFLTLNYNPPCVLLGLNQVNLFHFGTHFLTAHHV